jgi:branched-chain amino acid transport system permease protein
VSEGPAYPDSLLERRRRFGRIWIVLVLATAITALAVLGKVLPAYYVGLLTQVLILAIFAMSMDILLGYAGLPSLGHAAMFGAGAYGTALVALKLSSNVWAHVGAGLAAAVVVSLVVGVLALRASGPYFLMITLALAQLLWALAFSWRALTGGDDGLPGVPRPYLGPLPADWGASTNFFFLALLVFVASAAAMYLLVQSPFGYALRGIRESQSRMEALGYNVWLYKYLAFIFAGLFAGVAGTLFVYYHGFVSPDVLGLQQSGNALLMVILGGAGTLWGGVLGAAILVLLINVVSSYTVHWQLILGVVYILIAFGFRRWLTDRVRLMLR